MRGGPRISEGQLWDSEENQLLTCCFLVFCRDSGFLGQAGLGGQESVF